MKRILFISSNIGKIKEVKLCLKNFGVEVIGKVLKLPEIRSLSLEEVAKEKAKLAIKKFKKPLIVEDTGIYFEAYKNFPGVNSNFIIKSIGFEGIFKLLENKSRKAYFKTALAYCKPNKKLKVFTGICRGRITKKVRGKIDLELPYDNIFIPEGEKMIFSEMSKRKKERYSHRAKALRKFAEWFNSTKVD